MVKNGKYLAKVKIRRYLDYYVCHYRINIKWIWIPVYAFLAWNQ